jgi:hypothetical protein
MGRPVVSKAAVKPWEPLTQRAGLEGGAGLAEKYGLAPPDEIWGSGLYTCIVRYGEASGVKSDRSGLLWLSIHRRDRKPLRDWRHFQAIKNEVAGSDRVALEIYPSEANLVDTSNEYHLWVLPVGMEDLGFGFVKGGLVMTPEEVAAANEADADAGGCEAVQREWQPGLSTGPAARPRRGADASMNGPVEQTEAAAADRAVRMLLDGLEVESIRDLKRLVDIGRRFDQGPVFKGATCRCGEWPLSEYGPVCPSCEANEPVLGLCPHGVDLDREFCLEGCRV